MSNQSSSSIVSQMIAALQVVEPDLDTSIGTTVRNILDVVAEQQAQGYLDSNLSTYAYGIDNLTGSDLDAFVAVFGFTRFAARRATGVVTFSQAGLANPSSMPPTVIPAGSTLSVQGTRTVFQTASTYTLNPSTSTTSVDVPVIAVVGGTAGNVEAGTITTMTSPLSGITSVTNAQATSGGTDAESDAALIARFKATVFRSFTGTTQSFLGVALENPAVSLANVIGSVSTHQEQIEVINSQGLCVLDDVKFVYPDNQFLAKDLAAAASSVIEGTVVLGRAIAAGTTPTQTGQAGSQPGVYLYATDVPVNIQPNTVLQIGSGPVDLVTVAGSVYTTIMPNPTPNTSPGTFVPIEAYTPTGSTSAGATVGFTYNAGEFFTPGTDFEIVTNTLLVDPQKLPNFTIIGSAPSGVTPGPAFQAGTTLQYQLVYANANGTTLATPVATITIPNGTSGYVEINLPQQYNDPPEIMESLTTYIYGRGGGGGVQLMAVVPGTTSQWTDYNTIVPSGALPTSNTTGFNVAVHSLGGLPDGIYQVQFDYIPATSRNEYPARLNCIDIYTNGVDAQTATEALAIYVGPQTPNGPIVSTQYPTFVGDMTSPYFLGKFQREDGTNPTEGNVFIPLSFSPLLSLPQTLVTPTGGPGVATSNNPSPPPASGSFSYTNGEHYWLVNEIGPTGMSNQSRAGIEFQAGLPFGNNFAQGSAGHPSNVGTPALTTVEYDFNAVPQEIYQAIQRWRILSTDVMVHQAYPIYLDVYFVVVYTPGSFSSSVNPALYNALQKVASQISFNQVLEASSLLAAALAVPGVQNLRWALADDTDQIFTGYGIQALRPAPVGQQYGSVVSQFVQINGQVADIEFTSDTYPVINQVYTKAVAQNAFMQGGVVPLRPT